jgi:hypothetical protein
LGEVRSSTIQKLVDEVIELLSPMAHREWLPWGGEILFSGLREDIEREECKAEKK